MLKKLRFSVLFLTILSIFALNFASITSANINGKSSIFAADPFHYDENKGPSSHFVVGELQYAVVGDNLEVTYLMYTAVGCELTETHLAVSRCSDPENIDVNNFAIPHTKSGNPKVGQFPYAMDHNPGTTEVTYTIPLSDIGGEETGDYILIAAHAVVSCDCGEETAWANCEGPQFQFKSIFGRNGGSWASVVVCYL